jgi:hypothetical protein
VTPGFAASALFRLVDACLRRGIGATIGARYPARHRENLIQLFTPRYRDDPRALVRSLAAAAPRVDAVQLELGIPLRWAGSWRDRLLDAIRDALPALTARAPERTPPPYDAPVPEPSVPRRLEFTGPRLCGLVGLDASRGGRLLLFPPDGGLVLFTGERLGLEPSGTGGILELRPGADGALAVRFRGPLLRFPDSTPFLDLEAGLARARLVEAEVALDFLPHHPNRARADFGVVSGAVTLDGTHHAIAAAGFLEEGTASDPWPRLRAALGLGDGASVAVTVGLDGAGATGFLCRDGRHVTIVAARARLGPPDAPFERMTLDLELTDGARLSFAARAIHRLPVIRARGGAPIRLEFAACGIDGGPAPSCPAGWFEVGGLAPESGTLARLQ